VTSQLTVEAPLGRSAGSTEFAGRTQLQQFWFRFRKDRVAIAGVGLLVILIGAAVASPLIARIVGHGPNQLFLQSLNPVISLPTGPSSHFLFGVDQDGRDVFVRTFYALRTSLIIAVVAASIATVIGVTVGIAAAYFRGWVDVLVSRGVEIVLALPVLLFAISISSVCSTTAQGCIGGAVKPGITLVTLILILFTWPYIARIVRGQTLLLREQDFVAAASGFGASHAFVMFREILPNLVAPIVVYMTLIIPSNILFEAALSFFGIGVPSSTPSLGQMIADATNNSLFTYAWWLMVFPGAALLLITLAFNLVGDALRDALSV
jgi:peptide/nickel transport system permease protein